jgi:hypothetical protein
VHPTHGQIWRSFYQCSGTEEATALMQYQLDMIRNCANVSYRRKTVLRGVTDAIA